jgi:3-deoxy-D-manno-octulosonic-acid transferase
MQLGVSENQLVVTGNLKFDQEYPPVLENEKEELKKALGIQPTSRVIVAGSTHEGEEAVIAGAFSQIRRDHPDLILINAPRDPDRSNTIAHLYQDAGLNPRLWSERNHSDAKPAFNVIIIDTIGLLVKLYAICDIAIVGGSLIDIHGIGGHNPLEPAAFSKPVIFGKNMRNFRQIAGMIENAGGALIVDGTDQLSATLKELVGDPQRSKEIGKNANRVFKANKGAVTRTIEQVLEQLKSIEP